MTPTASTGPARRRMTSATATGGRSGERRGEGERIPRPPPAATRPTPYPAVWATGGGWATRMTATTATGGEEALRHHHPPVMRTSAAAALLLLLPLEVPPPLRPVMKSPRNAAPGLPPHHVPRSRLVRRPDSAAAPPLLLSHPPLAPATMTASAAPVLLPRLLHHKQHPAHAMMTASAAPAPLPHLLHRKHLARVLMTARTAASALLLHQSRSHPPLVLGTMDGSVAAVLLPLPTPPPPLVLVMTAVAAALPPQPARSHHPPLALATTSGSVAAVLPLLLTPPPLVLVTTTAAGAPLLPSSLPLAPATTTVAAALPLLPRSPPPLEPATMPATTAPQRQQLTPDMPTSLLHLPFPAAASSPLSTPQPATTHHKPPATQVRACSLLPFHPLSSLNPPTPPLTPFPHRMHGRPVILPSCPPATAFDGPSSPGAPSLRGPSRTPRSGPPGAGCRHGAGDDRPGFPGESRTSIKTMCGGSRGRVAAGRGHGGCTCTCTFTLCGGHTSPPPPPGHRHHHRPPRLSLFPVSSVPFPPTGEDAEVLPVERLPAGAATL